MNNKEKQNKIVSEVIDDIEKHISDDIEKLLNKESINMPKSKIETFDKFKIYQKISQKVNYLERIKKKNRVVSMFAWACASIIVLLFVNIGYSIVSKFNVETTTTQYSEVYVEKGDKLLVLLADGSRVWLNSDSKLSYSDFSSSKTRDVKLVGEAYFEVAKNEEVPFRVHTDRMCINVLGTSFNVRAYSTDEYIKTTLDKGKIQIQGLNDVNMSYMVKPGQTAIYKKGDNKCKILQDKYSVEASLWKNNQLNFRNDSLEEVLNTLKRKFNLNYIIEDSSVKIFTYTFSASSNNLQEVIEIMKSITPINITINNNVLLISHR